jgi:hypothetical protein
MKLAVCVVPLAAVIAVLSARSAAPAPAPRPEPKGASLKLELRGSPLTVKFVNVGKEAIRILKPLDGSEWCWIMPHYKLTIINEQDAEVGYGSRCATYGFPYWGTKWPNDYVVIIRPGASYTHRLSHNHRILEAGTYRLRFEYNFTPKCDRTPGGPYPPGLWRGSAISNTIETKLKPSD